MLIHVNSWSVSFDAFALGSGKGVCSLERCMLLELEALLGKIFLGFNNLLFE